MLLAVLILLAALFCGMISVRRFLARFPSNSQRSWLTRVGLFSFFGLLFLGVLIAPLPIKLRILALVPAFFLIAVASRVFRSAKERVEGTRPPNIEKMKRLN